MSKAMKQVCFGLLVLFCCLFHTGCTYYDADLDEQGITNPAGQPAVPYKTWVDQLRQTDQKRYQEYVLLRKHIDSNHAVIMNRVQALHDSTMLMNYGNYQQTLALRKQVHRLTNVVYFIMCLMLLGAAYFLFEQLKKRKQARRIQTISYQPVTNTESAVLAVSAEEEK